MTDQHTEHATALRSAGLNVTAQRIAILDAVTHDPHSTADGIYRTVTEQLGSISHQAVYDTLSALSERGLLRRIQPSHSPARFETRVGDNHHHLICRECGDVRDVDCAVHYTPCLTASDDHGFRIDEAEVIYWGICPTCTPVRSSAHG